MSRNRIEGVMQYAVTGDRGSRQLQSQSGQREEVALAEKAAGFLEPFLLSRGSIFGLWQT